MNVKLLFNKENWCENKNSGRSLMILTPVKRANYCCYNRPPSFNLPFPRHSLIFYFQNLGGGDDKYYETATIIFTLDEKSEKKSSLNHWRISMENPDFITE